MTSLSDLMAHTCARDSPPAGLRSRLRARATAAPHGGRRSVTESGIPPKRRVVPLGGIGRKRPPSGRREGGVMLLNIQEGIVATLRLS